MKTPDTIIKIPDSNETEKLKDIIRHKIMKMLVDGKITHEDAKIRLEIVPKLIEFLVNPGSDTVINAQRVFDLEKFFEQHPINKTPEPEEATQIPLKLERQKE